MDKYKSYTYKAEARDRNDILFTKYAKIPSYSLWRDIDIEKESIAESIKWWKTYEHEDQFKIISNNWIHYLEYELGIVKKSQNPTKQLTAAPMPKTPKSPSSKSNVKLTEITTIPKYGLNNHEYARDV